MDSIQRSRKRFIQEEQTVNRIMQLLDLELISEKNKFLLSMLMLLADSDSGRRKIAASGSFFFKVSSRCSRLEPSPLPLQDAKWLIGRGFNDPFIHSDMMLWSWSSSKERKSISLQRCLESQWEVPMVDADDAWKKRVAWAKLP